MDVSFLSQDVSITIRLSLQLGKLHLANVFLLYAPCPNADDLPSALSSHSGFIYEAVSSKRVQ